VRAKILVPARDLVRGEHDALEDGHRDGERRRDNEEERPPDRMGERLQPNHRP
jgi:hypothetical protein